jgi:phage shock protein E
MKNILFFILILLSSYSFSENNTVIDISQETFIEKISTDKTAVIIDIRTVEEFSAGHIPNAINIPHSNILANPALLDQFQGKDKIFYCHSGGRVKKVTDLLNTTDITGIYHLEGDFRAWQGSGKEVVK